MPVALSFMIVFNMQDNNVNNYYFEYLQIHYFW